jgi:hypothetical protein
LQPNFATKRRQCPTAGQRIDITHLARILCGLVWNGSRDLNVGPKRLDRGGFEQV